MRIAFYPIYPATILHDRRVCGASLRSAATPLVAVGTLEKEYQFGTGQKRPYGHLAPQIKAERDARRAPGEDQRRDLPGP